MSKKRAMSLLLALALCLCLVPMSALAVSVTEAVPCKYDMIDAFSDGMARVGVQVGTEQEEYDGEVYEYPVYQYGFIDQTGAEVIAPQYSWAENFSDGLALVRDGLRLFYIDKTGARASMKFEYAYYDPGSFHNGLAHVARVRDDLEEPDYRYGFVDKTGKEVIPCIYVYAWDFSEGLAAVAVEAGTDEDGWMIGKYGFIDTTGKEVIPCKYDDVRSFSNGLAQVAVEVGTDDYGEPIYEWRLVDTTGKEVVPGEDDKEDVKFSEGLAPVQKDGKWGFMNEAGQVVIPCIYDDVGPFSEGLAAVAKDGKCGFIDKTGAMVIPCRYDSADDFSEGLARVANYRYEGQQDGDDTYEPGEWEEMYPFWGFVDKTGKEVIPLEYAEADNFFGGLACVCYPRSAEWEIIDREGHPVAQFNMVYSDGWEFLVNAFTKGFIVNVGTYDVEMVFVDQTTKEQTSIYRYTGMRRLFENYAAVRMNRGDSYWGVIDLTGKEVVPCQYSSISSIYGLPESLVKVEKDGKFGIANINTGKEVVPCVYDRLEAFSDSQVKVGMDSGETDDQGAPIYKWGIAAVVPTIVSTGVNPEASGTSYASTQTVNVDGKAVEFQMYALKNANGDPTNYVKLRDVADALDGTAAQFNVTWAEATGVGIQTGTAYSTRTGQEGKTPFSGDRGYRKGDDTTQIDGAAVPLQAFFLTDDNGGDHTYYKLRDLGQALGFNVGYDSAADTVFIETNKPYDPNN